VIGINIGIMKTGLDIYHQLSRRGLTWSLRDLSCHYYGKATNYACLLGNRWPSEQALIHLFRRLWQERHFVLCAKVGWLILWGDRADG
jgi:hypothetical protein